LFEYLGHTDKERLRCGLDIDIRQLSVGEPSPQEVGDGVFRNYWGEQFIYRATDWGPMREDIRGALADAKRFDDLEAFLWPTPDLFDYSGIAEQCRQWDDYALLYGFADIWERPALVRGLENMFIDMCARPDWVHYLSRTFTDFYKEDYTCAAEAASGRIDLFLLISDLGCQRGPLISIKMFHEFIAPYIREMCDCIHSLGARVMFHSCGSIRPFIPELIALGVDVLDPIQPVAGMMPDSLKAEFGDQLAFHGGIDMQRLLPFGTPDKIRTTARHYCETLGAGGGYILAPAHLFQPDIPPENILAVYEV
jgi:uroporphyrinogen decarboxylase